jgi:uncharacterized protein YaeQ
MANEISVTATLTVTKSGVTSTGSTTYLEDLAGNGNWSNTQAIGTSDEQLAFAADLVAEGVGYVWLKNLDAANFVLIKINNAGTKVTFAKLLAGEAMVFPVHKSATTDPDLWAAADTAACNLLIKACGT